MRRCCLGVRSARLFFCSSHLICFVFAFHRINSLTNLIILLGMSLSGLIYRRFSTVNATADARSSEHSDDLSDDTMEGTPIISPSDSFPSTFPDGGYVQQLLLQV
jgi:DNA helicase HerA-like ATPase